MKVFHFCDPSRFPVSGFLARKGQRTTLRWQRHFGELDRYRFELDGSIGA